MTDSEQSRGRQVILPSSSPRAIEWAADEIRNGGVIAMPTDTVYGLAAGLQHSKAVHQLFKIKGRPADRPIPVLVSSVDAFERISGDLDSRMLTLVDEFWPGALTVVVPASVELPDEVIAADGTVGVRIPNHPLAIEVIERAGGAIACTSANRSDQPPATHAEVVAATLEQSVDLILDGGVAPGGTASTVVRAVGDDLEILREGPIGAEELRRIWDSSLG